MEYREIQEIISETVVLRRRTKTQRRNVQGLKGISDIINVSKKTWENFCLHS